MHMIATKSSHCSSTISYRSDFLPLTDTFSCFYTNTIHMTINCKIPYPLIEKFHFYNIPIPCLLSCKINLSICNSIEWSSLCRSNIYSIMTSEISLPSTVIISSEKHGINICIRFIVSISIIISSLNNW